MTAQIIQFGKASAVLPQPSGRRRWRRQRSIEHIDPENVRFAFEDDLYVITFLAQSCIRFARWNIGLHDANGQALAYVH